MKRFAKLLLEFLLISAVLGAVGQALSRRFTSGDEASDEFRLTAILGGAERTCTAPALRRGVVATCFGGVDLDLRSATLDPAGAELDLSACMGGVQVTVPDDWRVIVTEDARAGGVDVAVTDPNDLPEGSPRLGIAITVRMGGVAVTTG